MAPGIDTLPTPWRRAAWLGIALGTCLMAAWGGYRVVEQWQLSLLRQASTHQLALFSRSLTSTLDKYEHLPFMTTLHHNVVELLRTRDAALAPRVNRLLAEAQTGTDVAQFYLLDTRGTTVASSEPRLLGQNYAFRPYFQQAMAGRAGIFYAIGATTNLPGCFRSRPVRHGEQIIGAAVIKVSLDGLESAWRDSGARLALTDENGVVILSTVAEWKYRALSPLGPQTEQRIAATRQYAGTPITPLDIIANDIHPQGNLIDGSRLPEGRGRWLVQSAHIAEPGWQLLLFTDLREVRQTAAFGAISAALASGLLLFLAVYLRLRRKSHRDRLAAKEELQRVSNALEVRIAQRTADISAANLELQQRVDDLKKTESILRSTRDDAVQAGKLAVLGQLAAGVSHELNQPLTAMQMLAGNGIRLLDMGEKDALRDNLRDINDLVTRMGRIAGLLKSFARRAPTQIAATPLDAAIDNALFLLLPLTKDRAVRIVRQPHPCTDQVYADSLRLEQVLVNLLRNALQAMEGCPSPSIEITVTHTDDWVCVAIRDTGPGFSDDALEHLFEPFFTTKPQGEGLGLGLALSRAIVESFGGRLRAENAAPGARFEIFLKDATS